MLPVMLITTSSIICVEYPLYHTYVGELKLDGNERAVIVNLTYEGFV